MIDMVKMNEYLTRVKALSGTKMRMKSPIVRAYYEEKCLTVGHWMTVEEFEAII